MAALTESRNTKLRDGRDYELPAAAATKIFQGSIVAINATGFATKGVVSTTLKAVGIAIEECDNTSGADGAKNVKIRKGVFALGNSSAGDLIARANVNADCFIVDDQTVALTNGSSTRSIAGKIRDVDGNGVWVEF